MATATQPRYRQQWLDQHQDQAEPLSEPVKHPDYYLLITVVTLVIIGLVMVFSASLAITELERLPLTHYLVRHGIWVALGLGAMLVTMHINYHHYRKLSLPLLLVSLVLLVAVLAIGRGEFGARRWFSIGQFTFQPSELAKLGLIFYFADWLSRPGRPERVRSVWYGFIQFAVVVGIFAALVILQPDRGTATVIAGTSVAIFFVAGAHILQMGVAALVGSSAMWLILNSAAYSRQRLAEYFDPERSYHMSQALMAFGSGGATGMGLGLSRQKMMFLPVPHTDTILAVIGEEFGFVGCVAIILLFIAFAMRGYRVAAKASDRFGALIATGITSWIVIQAFLNIGSVTSTTPFTGVPLPLISYGGSAVVIALGAIGILLNISKFRPVQESKAPVQAEVIE